MKLEAIEVFVSAFCVSALGGLAALLRSNIEINRKLVLSAILNSGILGLGIALLWYIKYQDNLYFLVGVCVIAGLSGQIAIDTLIKTINKFVSKDMPNGK